MDKTEFRKFYKQISNNTLKMKIWVHFLTSLILAAILYPTFSWIVIFIFIGGVLIDIDHYINHAFRYKNLKLSDCYNHYIVTNKKNSYHKNIGILLIFHTIEFIILMSLLSFYSNIILMATIGLLTHFIMDLIYTFSIHDRLVANYSLISWIIKNKIQKV